MIAADHRAEQLPIPKAQFGSELHARDEVAPEEIQREMLRHAAIGRAFGVTPVKPRFGGNEHSLPRGEPKGLVLADPIISGALQRDDEIMDAVAFLDPPAGRMIHFDG